MSFSVRNCAPDGSRCARAGMTVCDAVARKAPTFVQLHKYEASQPCLDARELVYRPASHGDRDVPQWIDGTLEKAVHPNPYKRYNSFSEFLFDLRHPNANYLSTSSTPLIERNPLLFWKSTTIVLALAVIVLLALQHGMHR